MALRSPRPVRAAWLCEVLDLTPGALRQSVTRLRRITGDELVQTSVAGYRLDAPVDALLVCDELQAADGDVDALQRALDRWIGPALNEFAGERWAIGDALRLGEIRATAVEDLADALIANGQADEAIARLEPHLIEHPYRDRARGLMIRALAAAGRTTEGLRAYQVYRTLLADEVGTEPSGELRRVEQRVAGGWDGIESDVESSGAVPDRPVAPGASWELPEVLAAAPRLVGRRTERQRLALALEGARLRGPGALLLAGEPGIGKTTLIAAFAREHCGPGGWRVLYGRCDETATAPFEPFRALLGCLVDALPEDALMAHTATWGGDLHTLLPHFGARVPSTTLPADETTSRYLLFEAVVDVVRRAAEITPLVLVLDDLHWAEQTALELLRHLMRNLVGVPVLFVASFRDTGEFRRSAAEHAG